MRAEQALTVCPFSLPWKSDKVKHRLRYRNGTLGKLTERNVRSELESKASESEKNKRERCSAQMESNSRGTDSENGNFSPVEGFDSLHWVITP